MGITSYEWGPRLQNEALKCWFYGISWSILLGYSQLVMLFFSSGKSAPSQDTGGKRAESEDEKESPESAKEAARKAELQLARSRILTQLAIDHCDIFIPGSAVGWIPAGPVGVGTCQSISSVLAMQQVWAKVQVS